MENNIPFAQYSDEPVYNIQAVAEQTEVPALTLRAWERRYDIPKPERDTQGHRLYSERDIMMIKWLKQQVDSSMRIKQAVQLLQSQNPQYLGAPASAPVIAVNTPVDSQFEQLVDNLYLAIKNFDYPQSQIILTQAFSLYSIEDVCLGIVIPVFAKIDQGYVSGEISSQIEHFGSSLIRERLLGILTTPATPIRGGRIVVGCVPHEWHEIGALIFSLFLRRRGWEVVYLGQNVGFAGLSETLQQLNPDLFTFSITHLPNLHYLADAASIVHHATDGRGIFSFAGHAFNDPSIIEILDDFPGVFLGHSLPEAVEKVEDLLGKRWQPHDYSLPELPADVDAAWTYVHTNHVLLEGVFANLLAESIENDYVEIAPLSQQFLNIFMVALQYNQPAVNYNFAQHDYATLSSFGMDVEDVNTFVRKLSEYWQNSAPDSTPKTLIAFTNAFLIEPS